MDNKTIIRVAVIGDVPDSDWKTISASAQSLFKDTVFEFVKIDSVSSLKDNLFHGFISFMPPEPKAMQELFASLPVGGVERLPVFQVVENNQYPEFLLKFPVSGVFRKPLSNINVYNMLSDIINNESINRPNRDLINEVIRYRKQKHQLINISTALSSENDLGKLLELILTETRDVLYADAGSIYVRERKGPGRGFTNKLRFKVSQNDSVEISGKTKEFSINIDQNTVAGYVADTCKILNIEDVYGLGDSVSYKFGKSFDRHFGYRMKSMLTVPLKDLSGTVVGVIQLMNKKREHDVILSNEDVVLEAVESFTRSDEDFVLSIASLAAVSIERARLHEDIQQLFEGFLDSSIAAVDERDRVTSGHSRRVMGYTMAFVDTLNSDKSGVFADVHFSDERKRQIKFAALLHDIGKIGVPEGLLNKENRIPRGEFDSLMTRMDFVRYMISNSTEALKNTSWKSVAEFDDDREFLLKINKSGFLDDENFQRLKNIRDKTYIDVRGVKVKLLRDSEWESLSIRKGNLTAEERDIINSHARATRRILSKIPWTRELEEIPEIAAHHHERLDGTGYPDGLTEEEISLESKILAVVDIYEALVAQDRPYKPAMPPSKACDILRTEANCRHLDSDVVDFFIKKGIWKIFLDQLPSAK